MDTEQDLALIDNFIQGSLSDEERDVVAARINSDSSFQELYQFTLSVKQATQHMESARIKQMLRQVKIVDRPLQAEEQGADVIPISVPSQDTQHRSVENRRTIRWPLASMGIAASLLFALFVWQPTKTSNEELFASYATTGAALSSSAMPDAARHDKSIGATVRGEEYGIEGFTSTESESFELSQQLIRAHEPERAKAILKQLIREKGEIPVLVLHLSTAQLSSNEVDQAIDGLEKIRSHSDRSLKDDVEYRLALGYIKTGKLRQARVLLESLKVASPTYAASATDILSKLRWWF